MTDGVALRAMALGLAGATEQDHHGRPSFRVWGKIFATWAHPERLNVMLDVDGIDRAVTAHPELCTPVWWGARMAAVQVDLSRASPELVAALLTEAWERRR